MRGKFQKFCSDGIVRLVFTVGYCMVKIRGYHDVGQSSLHLAKLTRLERFSVVSGGLKCSLVWS